MNGILTCMFLYAECTVLFSVKFDNFHVFSNKPDNKEKNVIFSLHRLQVQQSHKMTINNTSISVNVTILPCSLKYVVQYYAYEIETVHSLAQYYCRNLTYL